MTKVMSSFVKRGILFVLICITLHVVINNVVTSGVAPVVTQNVALEQMRDTDVGHAQMRMHSTASNDAWTFGPPIVMAVLAIILFAGPTAQLIKQKQKEKV